MNRIVFFLWAACARASGPAYTTTAVVNAASGQPGAAPNTIVSVYGSNLSSGTHALTTEEMRTGAIPTRMQGTQVLLSGQLANLYFVSPGQINLLIPATFKPGKVDLTVLSDGRAGPSIPLDLSDAAPALFEDGTFAVATNAQGEALTANRQAGCGEVVILYATGLGATEQKYAAGELARSASYVKRFSEFVVMLAGVALDSSRVLYAGVTPGFAGLYQVNLRLPDDCTANPEVRAGYAGNLSQAGLNLRVKGQ